MSMLDELKRRNVFRVAVAYIVVGWLIAQVAEFAFENFGAPEWVLKVVVVLLLLGLPIALLLAWAFEMTPDGVKLERDVDRDTSITGQTGKKLNTLTTVALVAAVAILGIDRFVLNGSADNGTESDATPVVESPATAEPATADTPTDKSIAVLPFVAMTASEDDEFFADGLSEELLNVLAKMPGLKVAGRTSSFYYKGRNEDLREIASALGVAHILEGSVRRSGSQIRVTAQLIKADDGFHLWSNTYDRPDGDVFIIQDDISRDVANALQATILGADSGRSEQARPQNVEAQNYYLIAQAAMAQRGLRDTRRARELYAKASGLDKENPKYLAGYAAAVALQYWNYRDISADEAIYEASTAIDATMELGPPSADTLAIAGLVEELRAFAINDPAAKERALKYYQDSLELEPNNILALQWIASIYLDINQAELSKAHFEKVVELDPLNVLALTGLANAYGALGLWEDGRRHLYRVQSLFPDLHTGFRYMSFIEYEAGRLDKSSFWTSKATVADPNPLEIFFEVQSFAALGWADEALETAERYRVTADTDISRMVQAWLDKDYQALATEATPIFAQTGEPQFANISAWANAKNGNCRSAITTLERLYPSLRAEVIEYIAAGQVINGVLLSHCYAATNDTKQAERLINALLASESLSQTSIKALPSMLITRVAALAVAGRVDDALQLLESLDFENMPVSATVIALPADELPVFENLYDTTLFQRYATQERYRIAQQGRMLASGETEAEIIADAKASGYEILD